MTKTILLVEDNASDEKLALLAFKNCGVDNRVLVRRDGAEALDFLLGAEGQASRGPESLPALVLLDLKLPKVSGLEVLRKIREDHRTRHLAVVILTASKEKEDLQQGYRLGANAYVRKPVDFTEFAQATKTIAHFWLVLNERPQGGVPS